MCSQRSLDVGVLAVGLGLLALPGCRADPCPTGSVRLSDDLCHLLPSFAHWSEGGIAAAIPSDDSAAPVADDDACTPDHPTADDVISMVHAVPLDEDPFAHVLDLQYRPHDTTLFATGEGGLMAFDVAVPTAPVLQSHVVTDETTRFHWLALGSGARVYTASADFGLYAWETTDPSAPTLVQHLESASIRALAVDQEHVVTALNSGALVVYRAEESALVERARMEGLQRPTAAVMASERVYVADAERGLLTVSTADEPSIDHIAALGLATDLKVDETTARLYAAAGSEGVVVFDLSDPDAPVRIGAVHLPQSVRGLSVDGHDLWAANQTSIWRLDAAPSLPIPLHRERSEQLAMDVVGVDGVAWVADWEQLATMEATARAPVPVVDVSVGTVLLREGRASVPISNPGSTPLQVERMGADEAALVVTGPLKLAAGASGTLEITTTATDIHTELCLATDDPDRPVLRVPVRDSPPEDTVPALGEPAPDFELVDLDGNPRRLSDAAGRPVVLMFFATWCPACVPELTEVEARLWPEWGARGVEFWAIGSENEVDDLERFVEDLGLTFPILPDPSQAVFTAFELPEGPGLYPREWLIDSTGHVAYVTNRFEPDALAAALAADPAMAEE